jgi:hypothetical protein
VARERRQKHGGTSGGTVSLRWILVLVGVALVATVTAAMKHRSSVVADAAAAARASAERSADAAAQAANPNAIPVEVINNLTSIPIDTWRKAGSAGAAPPVFVGGGNRSGKPVVLYIGAGFCPYCAAARWSLITSLARFGTFTGLSFSASSSLDVFPRTPTFSFYGAHYASRYIELQTVEQASDEPGPDGRYVPLERATAEQQSLLEKYDVPPYVAPQGARGIPFILVGQRYMWSGAPFSPQLLAHHTQTEIAASLPAASSDAARAILANANMFTATICALTGNQPADVCSDPVIQRAVASLPTKSPS